MDVNIEAARASHTPSWINDFAILGAEDVTVDAAREVAYVSSQDRRAAEWVVWGVLQRRAVDWAQRGAIYKVGLNGAHEPPSKMTDDLGGKGFHPCGIDLQTSESGGTRLFVVNWIKRGQFAVEVFKVDEEDGSSLHHIATAESDQLTLPNDIVALDENRFYVTNSVSGRLSYDIQAMLGLPTGNVLLHDLRTGRWDKVAGDVPYANGIAVDRVRDRLYVSSSTSRTLFAFRWNANQPAAPLSRPERIALDFVPDNLAWENPNTLWIAGSDAWLGAKYTFLLRDRAPSRAARLVLPLDPKAPLKSVMPERVYEDAAGVDIAACSIAAPFKTATGERRFIVGACFDDHAVLCRAST